MSRSNSVLPLLEALTSGLRSFRWLAVVVAVSFLCSGVTIVGPHENVLVLRMGKLIQVAPPGLLVALSYPIDEIVRVPVKQEGEVVVEELWRALDQAAGSDRIDPLHEGYVLTGDRNVVQLRMTLRYKIDDPASFALRVRQPERMLRDLAAASASSALAGWRVDDVLRLQGAGGGVLARTIRARADRALADLALGVSLTAVEVNEIHPPRHVVAEFQAAQSARVERETLRREAEASAAQELPMARARRDRLVKEAEVAASALRAEASTEFSVFEKLHAELRRNPELVRERLYRETLETALAQVGRRFLLPPGTKPGTIRAIVSDGESHP